MNPLMFHKYSTANIFEVFILVKFIKMIKYICIDQPLHFLVSANGLVQTLHLQHTLEEEAEALWESVQPI